ncbi:hypothetical protein GCM10027422_41690 [Hymenobacter arcticus]
MPSVTPTPYTVPAGTSIGHIHLQVTDMPQALAFYHGLLGFEVMVNMGSAAFLSADGYHHHIGLKHLASHLGIAPETLSRLRAKRT